MNRKTKNVISYILLVISLFTFLVKPVYAEEGAPQVVSTNSQEVNVYMFRGDGCAYCAKALTWFDEIEEAEGSYFNLITYEVWNDESNKNLMNRVSRYLKDDDASGVPYIIVGNKTYSGFDESDKTEILNSIHEEYAKNVDDRFDVMKDIKANKDQEGNEIVTYIIIIVFVTLFGFVVLARKASDESEYVNYEEIITEEEDSKKEKEEKNTPSKENKKAGVQKKKKSKSASKKSKK